MNVDPASMAPHPLRTRTTRADRAAGTLPWFSDRTCIRLALAALALGFVVLGADGLDVGPADARLGLAAGGSIGPMGQVLGYWAPDLWPGEVLPSIALARLSPGSRANSAVVRWPVGDGGDPRRVGPGAGHASVLRLPGRHLGRGRLVRLPGRHRSLGRRGPRHDPRGGDPGGHRPLAGPGRGLGRRDSGPPWRSWPGGGRR